MLCQNARLDVASPVFKMPGAKFYKFMILIVNENIIVDFETYIHVIIVRYGKYDQECMLLTVKIPQLPLNDLSLVVSVIK